LRNFAQGTATDAAVTRFERFQRVLPRDSFIELFGPEAPSAICKWDNAAGDEWVVSTMARLALQVRAAIWAQILSSEPLDHWLPSDNSDRNASNSRV